MPTHHSVGNNSWFIQLICGPSSKETRSQIRHEILLTAWNLKGHYHTHNSPPPIPIPTPINPVHAPIPLLKIHFNIILLSTPGTSKLSSFFRLLHQTLFAALSPHTCYMPHPSHSSLFHHWNDIFCGVQIVVMLFSPLSCYLLILLPSQHSYIGTLLSKSFSLCSSTWVTILHNHTKQKAKL
jgi:hypothetical protein